MKRSFTTLMVGILTTMIFFAGCSAPGKENPQEIKEPSNGSSSVTSEDNSPQVGKKADVTLLIAAAASMEYSFSQRLIPLFTEQYPWIKVEGSYDSSGKLQTQIEEGLEATVFLSASTKQMDALVAQGLVTADSVVELLENQIVLIVPVDSTLDIHDFPDLLKAERIALGDPESVPVGQYSKEALERLGLWEQTEGKASFGTNVTEVLAWVSQGSAEVGIVYATDAATTDQVRVVAFLPEGSLSKPVIYPVGIIAASPNQEAAKLFVEFLQSEAAAAVFVDYGFYLLG